MFSILKIVIAAFAVMGCAAPNQTVKSETQAIKKEGQAFKKEALTLFIKADPELNRFESNSHTLFLCLYQLNDPNGFYQLAQEKNSLAKLMECNRFDATVANAKRFVVQPGQELKDVRDLAEGARYIGIATGYYGFGNEKVTELLALTRPAGRIGEPSENTGSIVKIELGPCQISSVEVK